MSTRYVWLKSTKTVQYTAKKESEYTSHGSLSLDVLECGEGYEINSSGEFQLLGETGQIVSGEPGGAIAGIHTRADKYRYVKYGRSRIFHSKSPSSGAFGTYIMNLPTRAITI